MFSIVYRPTAVKQLSKIPLAFRSRIVSSISSLAQDPRRGKKLQGKLKGIYSLRVWPYRILYQIGKKTVTVIILSIGHRQWVYG